MRFAIAALSSSLVAAADSYEAMASPIMYATNQTYAGFGTQYYSFSTDNVKWVNSTNQVSFTRPVNMQEGDIASVFSCAEMNPNNEAGTEEPPYVCTFFSSRSQSSANNGAMTITVRQATLDDIHKNLAVDEMTKDPASLSGWSIEAYCTYTVVVTNGDVTAVPGEESACSLFDVPTAHVSMTSTGWTARITHDESFSKPDTVTTVIGNYKQSMYALGTGTWLQASSTNYYNVNVVGMTDTAELPEIDDNSGALAFGFATVAAALAFLSF